MNIPLDHECFNWEWKVYPNSADSFIFSVENGRVGYRMGRHPFIVWGDIDLIERAMPTWVKYKSRSPFCGPMQPPLSKVILKIRQMEARRNHVQCG